MYQDTVPFEKRQAEANDMLQKYRDRIPVIVQRRSADAPPIDKRKFLVPSDLTFGQLVYVIRKRLALPAEKAVFVLINNQLPLSSELMIRIYHEQKNADDFLYVYYCLESTFGTSLACLSGEQFSGCEVECVAS